MRKQKVLIIVESPKKIKKLSSFLPDDNDYTILPTAGHVADLAKTGKYNLGIDLEKKYRPNFIVSDDRIDIMKAIVSTAKYCDKILVATDPDREGEHIGYSVIKRISTDGKIVKRIKFNDITKATFLKALKNEQEINDNLVQAAISRRVLDRVVGFMASPLLIKRVEKGLSAGRVQSVALRLVVDREKEIEEFKAEEYWVIQTHLNKFAGDIPIIAKLQSKDPINNKNDAESIKTELENSSYKVTKIESKEKKVKPPFPITTAELQKLASSRFGFKAQHTMKLAQTLYEEGDITYLRTDSIRQSDEAISDIRDWIGKNNKTYLPSSPNIYKNKDAAQDAHEAIRPTHMSELPSPNPRRDEDKLYKLIWEVTVATQMTPAVYDTTTVTITTNKKRELKAYGRVLKELGFLSVTKLFDDSDVDDKDSKLPVLVVGDILNLIVPPGVVAEQKFTQPPSRYSEHTLIDELKKRGIGRPSTYADIMGKISDRKYVIEKGKAFVATDIGKKVVAFLVKYFDFMDYDYTSAMEEKLDKIESGKMSYIEMMDEFYPAFLKKVDNAYKDTDDNDYNYECNKCNKRMIVRKSKFGYFLGCTGYPECKNIIGCDFIDGKVVPINQNKNKAPAHIKCPKCSGEMVSRKGKFGAYYSCANAECKGWMKAPVEGKKCPNCGSALYKTFFNKPPNRGSVLCCTSYPKCRYVERLENAVEELKESKREQIENEKTFSEKKRKTDSSIKNPKKYYKLKDKEQ